VRRIGKPYVTLDCRYDDPIAINAAAVVISHELRDQAYVDRDLEDVFLNYQAACTGLVIFTFGSDHAWYARAGEARRTHVPYKIDPSTQRLPGIPFEALSPTVCSKTGPTKRFSNLHQRLPPASV